MSFPASQTSLRVIAALRPLEAAVCESATWTLQQEFNLILSHMRAQNEPSMLGYQATYVDNSGRLDPIAMLVAGKLPPSLRNSHWPILFKVQPHQKFRDFLAGNGWVLAPLFTSPHDFYVRLQQAHDALALAWPAKLLHQEDTRLLTWEADMRRIALAYGLHYEEPEVQTIPFKIGGALAKVEHKLCQVLGLSLS